MSARDISETIETRSSNGKRRRSFWSAATLTIAALLLAGCATGVRDTSRSFKTVVIDAGHGGHDNGGRSRWAGQEKNHALDVALRLNAKLRAAGFSTVMTRSRDEFIELNQRAAISNRQSNAIFVSVHFNQTRSRRIQGAEVYYRSDFSRPIAERVLRNIDSIPGVESRGVKRSNFRVLKLNQYPAILVECGFLSHRSEGSRCNTAAHRERLAEAIARGIVEQRHAQ
jgi:N-acetylmuramoyl-L-alanine amidase